MDIKGKRAFVSGAARRLGREIVLHLARRGCDVIAHYNHSTTEAMSLRTESGCMLFQENFAKAKIDHLTERLQNEVGNIDILINNASSFQKSRWEEISEELWDQEFAVNLKTPFFLA